VNTMTERYNYHDYTRHLTRHRGRAPVAPFAAEHGAQPRSRSQAFTPKER